MSRGGRCNASQGHPSIYQIWDDFPDVPFKVLRAKMDKLGKQRLVKLQRVDQPDSGRRGHDRAEAHLRHCPLFRFGAGKVSKRIAHVLHWGSKLPRGFKDDDLVYRYGQGTSGIVDYLIVHDAPMSAMDQEWLNHNVMTRIAPGGTIVSMDDHD